MTEIARSWEDVKGISSKVPARPVPGIWTRVLDYVAGPVILRITARGEWCPISSLPACGPEGFNHWVFARDLLILKKAPPGALIAKIGGSSSGVDDSPDLFLIGSEAVLTLEKAAGPLYLTINDAPSEFADNTGEIEVAIQKAG